jgi:hypothetical protein
MVPPVTGENVITCLYGKDPLKTYRVTVDGEVGPQVSVREQCERDWHRLNEYCKAQKAQGVKP